MQELLKYIQYQDWVNTHKLLTQLSAKGKSILKKMNFSDKNMNLLHVCVKKACTDNIVDTLVGINPDWLHQTDTEGYTPLHYSIIMRDILLVYNLLFNGSNVMQGNKKTGASVPYMIKECFTSHVADMVLEKAKAAHAIGRAKTYSEIPNAYKIGVDFEALSIR